MDPNDSGQGQEKLAALTPSSRGRHRRANTRYSDYETDASSDVQRSPQKPQRTRSGGGGAKKTPTKRGKAEDATQGSEDGEQEATDETPQGGTSEEETPKRATRAKKTPVKKTPAKKTPVKKTPAKKTPAKKTPAKKTAGVVDTEQLENGTPKPKRRYVRKQPPPAAEAPPEPPIEPEETTPSGRHRRGAAKAALKYFHILAKEVLNHPGDELDRHSEDDSDSAFKSLKGSKGRRGRKRKRYDSDAADDEDFVPNVKEEQEEEEEEEDEVEEREDEEEAENSDSSTEGRSPATYRVHKNSGRKSRNPNGLPNNVMNTVWEATDTARKFREEHHSSWVFPEWVVSTKAWHLVPPSDLERYLPQELQSAAFRVSREGLAEEETPLQRLGRFTAVAAHPDRWDMLLYAGGPVWAMEWCPTPDGAPASQYVALACHRGMDDQHCVNKMYSGVGLVQLWDLGTMEFNTRPDSQPVLAYGLAQDKGFVRHLKWCPAGGWELPSAGRKDPFLPRLGLLAVATSTGVVTIYSLPHPDALHSSKGQTAVGHWLQLPKSSSISPLLPTIGKDTQLPIYQAEGVLTLKLGSLKAPRHGMSGQILSMDWLPEKPHNLMAVGFYDGVVGLWDLSTKSSLLRLQDSGSLTLLPYRCLLAHDNAVRALAFCPASRFLLVTAGEDRYVKTWDLRRLYDPITVQKRYLTNEIYWPLNAPGLLMAQETAYAPYGSQGVHYFDHHFRAVFAIPRIGTVWSVSYTEWLNGVVTADSLGEVILCLLPQIGVIPQYVKRTLERRFPVYLTSLMPHEDATKEDHQEVGGVQEEEEDAEEEQEAAETEGPDAGGEGEDEDEGEIGGGGGGRKDDCPPLRFQTYNEAVKRNWIHQTDSDLRTFTGSVKRSVWKRMKDTELKTKLNLNEMPLSALHKVRFNPNMCCHTWLVSGGQSGLVRINCLRAMNTSQAKKTISENRAQFNALYSPKDQEEL